MGFELGRQDGGGGRGKDIWLERPLGKSHANIHSERSLKCMCVLKNFKWSYPTMAEEEH